MVSDPPCPHDLLWFNGPDALTYVEPPPNWINTASQPDRPVVVRRDLPDKQGRIPVGIRGEKRHERMAAYLDVNAITRRLSPESLVHRRLWEHWAGLPSIRALQTLARIAPLLNESGYRWGPTGSIAFSLATGELVSHTNSDLDLVLRITQPLQSQQAWYLQTIFDLANCQLDVQIDTGYGAFSFEEWRRQPPSLLLKTNTGPVTVICPWHPLQ